MKKKSLAVIYYLIAVHLSGIVFFMLLRLVLYFTNTDKMGEVENGGIMLFMALIKGLQFDNYIASYISVVPVLLLSVAALFNRIPKWAVYTCCLFFIIMYAITFSVSVADIPYFSYFFMHIGFSALEWFRFGSDTSGMILGEKSYYPYFALITVYIAAFVFAVRYFGKRLLDSTVSDLKGKDYFSYIPLTFLLWLVCFAGMRGSFQRYPLRTGYAYFSDNSLFNQLGINPAFYLMKSYSGKQYRTVNDLMTATEAIEKVRKELGISSAAEDNLTRFAGTEGESTERNVVIILMESMSAACLEYEYNGTNLTPFLHELIGKSYYFENFYSSGIHTNNGIVSSLYGIPALFNKPMMENITAKSSPVSESSEPYTGLPYYLHKKGYRNMFFVTGNPNYDSMNEFLLNKYFDRIYSLYDYPSDKVANNFGVQDDYLFEYGLEILNSAGREKAPFLATFLTVSNHPPIIVPAQFHNSGDTDDKRILAFADNSLKMFMEGAAKQEWYNNTIFVLLGDHGMALGQTKYDLHLSHNHIPCIIFSPQFDDMPKRLGQYGGQIDLFPTIMGLLNCSYENNSLGIDLLRETRPYMFFVTDNHLGCINDKYLYIRNQVSQSDFLHDRHSEQVENLAPVLPETMEKLKNYSVSMTVVTDYLLSK